MQRSRWIIFGPVVLVVGVGVWYAALPPATPTSVNEPPPHPAAFSEEEVVPDPPPPDPRLTFSTPFRNVRPEVHYVGDARCTDCHQAICDSYHQHPMGRSAAKVGAESAIEKYDAKHNNPFTAGPYRLRVEKTGNAEVHRVTAKDSLGKPLPPYVVPVDLVIGSGTRGRSYFSTTAGAVWQSPASWFSHELRWDLSPGFDLGTGGRRAIGADCMFCHIDRVEPVPKAINRYKEPLLPLQAAVGCERCHGPGALHVAEREEGALGGAVDTSIVNPKHLAPALRASICAQCHLQGEERVPCRGRAVFEFRPGLPFEQFVTVFVRPPDSAEANRSVGQFEQMEQSLCFTASNGWLDCTSCHDPHTAPSAKEREAFYRARCLTCHEKKGCSAPLAERQKERDSCIACHMPRAGSANIPHTSVTDHRVPRHARMPKLPPAPAVSLIPLVAFQRGHLLPQAEQERNLGVALAWAAVKLPPTPMGPQQTFAAMAEGRLTRSLKTWRGDSDAWLALSFARAVAGDTRGRFLAASAASRLAPDSDESLAALVESATAARRYDRAEQTAAHWMAQNPTAVEPRLARTMLFARQGQWEKAEADARAALAIQPLHPEVRLYLALCRHQRGDRAGGRAEADTAAGLATTPQQRAAMLDWYRRQTR